MLSGVLVAVFLIFGNAGVLAQGGPGGGGGGAGGGGGGAGGGAGGGGTAPDFGDMIVLLRNSSGVPIPSEPQQVIDPETGQLVPGGICLQPLAAPGVTLVNTVTGVVGCTPSSPSESCLIPVDQYSCSIIVGYESYAQAVDFARMNVARAPDAVMDRQLADLLVTLSSAQCLTLDPAGRIVATSPDTLDSDGDGDTTELISKAVDSPLQNLAIYREMMTKGYLGAAEDPIVLPAPPIDGYGFIDTAAKGLGAAADKAGKIDVDVVVYLNQILGLSETATTTVLPKISVQYRQEVQGNMVLVTKWFLNYGQHQYQRPVTYAKLPFPAYIPATSPAEGWFEYLTLYPGLTTPEGKPLFWITEGAITEVIFADAAGFTGGNIGGFAQAADDARAVIEFVHSHPVLAGYETPIPCGNVQPPPQPVVTYDVALSALQMPIRMVGGTAREGTVTVTNSKGPDLASGTVTVTGVATTGTWTYAVSFDFIGLAAGASQSWSTAFTGPAYATTINWTAQVIAPFDVLSTNNSMTASTRVMKPRGKSGSGEGEE